MKECLFCRIARREVPAKIVDEGDLHVAFEDISPQAPHHVLLAPRRHVASVLELEGSDAPALGAIHAAAARIARARGIDRTGFRLVANTGPDAGQAVGHLHYHLLGGRKMEWPPG